MAAHDLYTRINTAHGDGGNAVHRQNPALWGKDADEVQAEGSAAGSDDGSPLVNINAETKLGVTTKEGTEKTQGAEVGGADSGKSPVVSQLADKVVNDAVTGNVNVETDAPVPGQDASVEFAQDGSPIVSYAQDSAVADEDDSDDDSDEDDDDSDEDVALPEVTEEQVQAVYDEGDADHVKGLVSARGLPTPATKQEAAEIEAAYRASEASAADNDA